MKIIKVTTLSSILSALFMASCNMASHNHFNAYMNKPFDSTMAVIKINGVYFIADYSKRHDNPPILFFLYGDGSVHSTFAVRSEVDERQFWNNPEDFMRTLKMNTIGSNPGHFWIRNNRIFIQIFDINPGSFYPINSLEMSGRVLNDSTFALSQTRCKWCRPMRFYKDEYKFYGTNIKADSSSIWFKKKSWYKKKVWN